MTDFYIDFETKSSEPIARGIANYLHSPHSDIVCMGWKRNNNQTKLWLPRQPFPFKVRPNDRIHAFNALFDFQVWHILGAKYDIPPVQLNNWHCAMALAGRYTHFQSLAGVCKSLKLNIQKDTRGKALIKKICVPPFSPPRYTQAEMREFYIYCINDVDAMYQEIHGLPTPTLSPEEYNIWLLTMRMNMRGVPIDSYAIRTIQLVLSLHVESESRRLPKITDGYVTKPTQVSRIIKWAYSQGVELPNVTKATVARYIIDLKHYPEDSPQYKVREVLKLRRDLAMTSTAKYAKLIALDYKGRVYDNLRYHGASTGRWAGLGAQLHNLPRAAVDDPQAEIEKFYDRSILNENPLQTAKALIRPMIKAPPNRTLIVSDYKAIENHGLMWLCDEYEALDMLAQGYDQYKFMAAELFALSYDEVNKDQRFVGKTLILGAGYNLGGKGYKRYAAGYGITLTDDQAEVAIQKYRARYKKVVKYWYAAKAAMLNAIQNPGVSIEFGKCRYAVMKDHTGIDWLMLTLPSNRSLFYNKPKIIDDKFGLLPTHMGINSYTRKWSRLKIIPGRIIENIVQAISRDILAEAKLRIDNMGMDLILSVHDEVVVECNTDIANDAMNIIVDVMSTPPAWCETMPLGAEAFITDRYMKG